MIQELRREHDLTILLDGDRVYLGEKRLTSAEAADYFGNYSTIFDYSDRTAVEAITTSTQKTPYLVQMSNILDECECPDSGIEIKDAPLEDIYGFAIDLAFRSNADTQLLLQTEAALRVDGGSELSQMQGEGSNLCLISDQLTVRQCVELMDAMRIGFLDSQNNILAVAKANTSNYVETEEGVSALLYLYAYEISEGGSLIMGERRIDDARITELVDGVTSVITAVVWLDGDYVTNSLVTIGELDVESKLNLQFASSVFLKPA